MLFDYSHAKKPKLVESAFVWAIAGCGGGFAMSPFIAIFGWMALGQPQVPAWLMIVGFVAWPIGPMWCFWYATRLIDRAYQ